MSDARWLDVADDVAEAALHFRNAVALHGSGRYGAGDLDSYRDGMALMHALQAGHTSAEQALTRILRILAEDLPTGEDWHRKLIERAAKSNGKAHSRPAILSPPVAADLDETRRFRNRAMRAYGRFDAARIGPTLDAAGRLAATLAADIERFKGVVDPD